jgi:hypothetical protein
MSGWIGFDLDGTIAEHGDWVSAEHIGEPIPAMIAKVKALIADGQECRIVTARVGQGSSDDVQYARECIYRWCEKHIGKRLAVTASKDFAMRCLYDDRAIAVECNTGRILGGIEPMAVLCFEEEQ